MNNPVATVESNDENAEGSFRPTEPGNSRPSERPAERFALAAGDRPLDGFTIKRGIGHGGFGEVYFATSDAGKEVALKLIRRNFDVELRGIKQCLNLKHPNLVSVFDIRVDDQGNNWVVMEHVGGEGLEEVIATHPDGLPVDQALHWIHGIGAGVAYLHDHGIVHRDLKPGNIFSDEGIVKIGDYGLSKFISCSRRSGQTESVGTVHYMAPEVANGRYGKEIDVYALGIILFELLTGRVPFEGESVGEVLMKHLTAEPDVSMLAEPYRTIVAGALRKDPTKRYGSVSQMLTGLPKPADVATHVGPMPSAAGGTADAKAKAADAKPSSQIPVAEPVDEEPIAKAVREGVGELRNAWHNTRLSATTKVILLVIIFFTLPVTANFVPGVFFFLMAYGVYWVIRKMVLSSHQPASQPTTRVDDVRRQVHVAAWHTKQQAEQAQPAASTARRSRHRRPVPKWARRESPAEALVLKPFRERITELVGSLVGSALVALTMCLVLVIVGSFQSERVPPIELCAWLVIVSVAGTWSVLIAAKFWEGVKGETILRRFILMCIGLWLGCLAFLAASLLHVDLPYMNEELMKPHMKLPISFYAADGSPLIPAFVACFGTLFLVVRWWHQADPLRSTRFSIWSTLICVLIAWVVGWVWLFPPQWLMMVAFVIGVSVQLTSPWVNPRQRNPDISE